MITVEELRARGRAARKNVSRSAHSEWACPADRDPVAIVHEVERGRIPELLPLRHDRMTASPFGFFRGATAVMARDLAVRPNSSLLVQICGDAHVRNLGAYASPEGHLVFDINDFDETTRAPFEWDLLRFATSLVLAGREAGDPDEQCAESVSAFVRGYREAMESFSRMPFLDLLRLDIKRMVSAKPVDRILRKAERATPPVLIRKLTELDESGELRFLEQPPLLRRATADERQKVIASLIDYGQTLTADRRYALQRYRPIDVAFKIVGTGSVGVRDYAVLCSGTTLNDLLFLQVKEEADSCYAPYVGMPEMHNGQRVAEGERLMQRTSDPFLGWTTIDGRHFLVRQLNDHKAAADPAELSGSSIVQFAAVAGAVFARAHARTGEAAALAAYCGAGAKLDRAVAAFASAYADQTTADHAQFVSACRAAAKAGAATL